MSLLTLFVIISIGLVALASILTIVGLGIYGLIALCNKYIIKDNHGD